MRTSRFLLYVACGTAFAANATGCGSHLAVDPGGVTLVATPLERLADQINAHLPRFAVVAPEAPVVVGVAVAPSEAGQEPVAEQPAPEPTAAEQNQ